MLLIVFAPGARVRDPAFGMEIMERVMGLEPMPDDYKSPALPTELYQHLSDRVCCALAGPGTHAV